MGGDTKARAGDKAVCQREGAAGAPRLQLYKIVTHKFFEWFVMFMIVANVVFMAVDGYSPPCLPDPGLRAFQSVGEYIFTFFFIIEAALKLSALFPLRYFSSGWNCFDFLLVSVSIFDMGMPMPEVDACAGEVASASLPFNPMLLRLLRMFRILRLVRLVRSAKGLRTLLVTIARCLPSIGIICSLLFLFCIIFATIGMQLFGDVVAQPHLGYGSGWPSFESFPDAMIMMLVMATSEQWPSLMQACMVQPPFCGPQAGNLPIDGADDCGLPWFVVTAFFMLVPAPWRAPNDESNGRCRRG